MKNGKLLAGLTNAALILPSTHNMFLHLGRASLSVSWKFPWGQKGQQQQSNIQFKRLQYDRNVLPVRKSCCCDVWWLYSIVAGLLGCWDDSRVTWGQVWDRRFLSSLWNHVMFDDQSWCTRHIGSTPFLLCWRTDHPWTLSSHLYCNELPHIFPPVPHRVQTGGGHNTKGNFPKALKKE